MTFDIKTFDVKKYHEILDRGLSQGKGDPSRQVCIEAAICMTLGLPHGDDPGCVAMSVRRFKIRLNDSRWSSPMARAKGLRELGIAQLGSLGIVKDVEFVKLMATKTIKQLIPMLFRDKFKGSKEALEIADECERTGIRESALRAKKFAYADAAYADAAYAAAAYAYAAAADAAYAYAADAAAAAAAHAADAADAAAYAAADAAYADKYLTLSANLALETLRELNSPGISLL